MKGFTYHSHFGIIDEPIIIAVWGSILDERQIRQIETQIRNARPIRAAGKEKKSNKINKLLKVPSENNQIANQPASQSVGQSVSE